ncbi:hypothetical protein [Pyxidicoccus caerfyrddinensis]|uniref:hypothetical protein n=1 Tax=Pyxidicoccus caerfyrddinensis TaxID=2709663 RepID=UPI0013DADB92|nr:hypothetical protein [Pyxidicoccus caerfyrddinensis]
MPITSFQLTPANRVQATYGVAKELARQSTAQYGAVRGAGAGIAGGSCCAAVASQPAAKLPAAHELLGFDSKGGPLVGNALNYAIAFGNSRLAQGKLDPDAEGNHAERVALNASGALFMVAANTAVLFVELTPCPSCQTWLNSANNPYHAALTRALNPVNLHVWWRWAYPSAPGLAAMNAFHDVPTASRGTIQDRLAWQLTDINNNW